MHFSPVIGTVEDLPWHPSFPGGSGKLDAIHLVTRGDLALMLAQLRPHKVPVTVWSNPDGLSEAAWQSLHEASDMDITVVNVPREHRNPLEQRNPSQEEVLRPYTELHPLSNVRNTVMAHAAGQRHTVALLDDDIEWSSEELQRAVPPRGHSVVAVGAHCQGVPDLSQINHIRSFTRRQWRERCGQTSRMRYIGSESAPNRMPLSSSGNALIVDAFQARLYYPPFYNEDRLATLDLAHQSKLLLVGTVTQTREPEISDGRASREILGEVMLDAATGWLREDRGTVPTAEYCARTAAGMMHLNRGTRVSIARYLARLATTGDTDTRAQYYGEQLAQAARRLSKFSGEEIRTVMSSYADVGRRFQGGIAQLPHRAEMHSLQYLGVEVLYRTSSAQKRMGLGNSAA